MYCRLKTGNNYPVALSWTQGGPLLLGGCSGCQIGRSYQDPIDGSGESTVSFDEESEAGKQNDSFRLRAQRHGNQLRSTVRLRDGEEIDRKSVV